MKEEQEDITDKLLELGLKLRAAESQLEALRLKYERELSQFAHNLNNPMGVARSFSEMLLENHSLDENKRAKYAAVIQSASQHSLELVNSFQEYNKLANTEGAFELERFPVNEFVNSLIFEVSAMLRERNQSLEFKNQCSPSTVLHLDPKQLRIAFLNLVQNASRFSEERTEVHFTVEEFEESISFNIADRGIGISEKDLPKLCSPFYTINTYDLYKEKCIGLGLVKAKLILEKMQGQISLKSNLEKGTQVQILLKKAV